MAYKCEERLTRRAQEFIQLLSKVNIDGEIKLIRNYLIKILIREDNKAYGNLNIYYSPKKDSYTLKTHELKDAQIEGRLIQLWTTGSIEDCQQDEKELKDIQYQIYVDGSFLDGKIGYGVVVLHNDQVVTELSGAVTDPIAQNSRQVGGELLATQEGVKWCQNEGIDRVAIYYDLENIKKWATGEYKTNNELTKSFKEFMDNSQVSIEWYKVAAHTGVKWNERADQLAKAGAKSAKVSKHNQDLIVELEEVAERFTDYLQNNGYSAKHKGIYNGNCAKIRVNDGIFDLGHINIYNTKKLHLIPKYHELINQESSSDLHSLWDSFQK